MQPFLEHDDRRFYRQVIRMAADFEPPFRGSPYPCLVWNHGAALSEADAFSLSCALIESDCRYIVSAGVGCESLHDAADQAFTSRFSHLPEQAQDERHVMTSWHSDEPMDDTTFFFAFSTSFDNHDFCEFLVLHVAGSAADHAAVEASIRKEVLDETAL